LDGRVAVVTGGGSGMGQATALRLAEAGAATVVADIAADKAQATVDLIGQRTPGARAVPLTVDVADRRRCARSATRWWSASAASTSG
jgi:glucose 1-dehydrogenase